MISKPLSLLQTTAASRRSLRAPLSDELSSRTTSDASKSRTGSGASLLAPSVFRAPAQSTQRCQAGNGTPCTGISA